MPQYVVSLSIDQVIAALGAFIQPFIGQTEIVRGQQNRVPPPKAAFVKLTELLEVDLRTPVVTNTAGQEQIDVEGATRLAVQVDFYGTSAGDWCKAVKTVYRSPYAPAQFPDGIKPLWCDDGRQMPLITGEEQYQDRWTITAHLQYNPVVSLPQQSATQLAVTLTEGLS